MASSKQQQDIDMSSGGYNLRLAGQQQPQQQPQQPQEAATDVPMPDISRDQGNVACGSGGNIGATSGAANTSKQDMPKDPIDALIDSITYEEAKQALRKHSTLLRRHELTTADVLKDSSQEELEGKGIPMGDAKRIKKAFPSAGKSSAAAAKLSQATHVDPTAPTKKELDGLQRLANVLLTVDISGDYLVVPADLPDELPETLISSIFIRKDYHEVVKRMHIEQGGLRTSIEEDAAAAALPTAPSARMRVFIGNVLTGPPGSGKSSIVLLILAYLARAKQVVVYRFRDPRNREHYLLMDFSQSPPVVDIEYTSEPARLAAIIRSSKTWLLWDGAPRDGSSTGGQFNNNGPAFFMSSPNDKNYHEFVKGKGAAVLHMKPFSLPEFLKVAKMYKIPPEVAVARYRIFGGVIRSAIIKLHEEDEAMLRKMISGDEALRLMNLDLVGMRSKVSHTLVHTMSDHNFKPQYLSLASPVVRDEVYIKAFSKNSLKMQRLVVAGAGKPGAGGFAGHMWEQHGHYTLPLAEPKVDMRQLLPPAEAVTARASSASGGRKRLRMGLQQHGSSQGQQRAATGEDMDDSSSQEDEGEEEDSDDEGGGDDVDEQSGDEEGMVYDEQPSHHLLAGTLEGTTADADELDDATLVNMQQQLGLGAGHTLLPKVKRIWDSPSKDISNLNHRYLQPPTTNNASWDAYYCHDEQRYALQYTVSDTHGIKQEPICKLLRRLKLEPDQVKLVFVVPALPAHLYDNFKWQPWQGTRGQKISRSRWLQMEQWVMKLPVLAQRTSGSGAAASAPA